MTAKKTESTKKSQNRPDLATYPQPVDWVRARARTMPDLLPKSPPWVRSRFEHAWAPLQALNGQVEALPNALWSFLLGCQGGFVLISNAESEYVPGPTSVRGQQIENVALISVTDLAQDNERPLHVIGHLIDHHLGSGGAAQGTWLSSGGGVNARWREAGARLASLFDLGYGVDPVAQGNRPDYFAQSLALYCRETRRINVADPQIDRWFRCTLWNAAYWRETQPAQA